MTLERIAQLKTADGDLAAARKLRDVIRDSGDIPLETLLKGEALVSVSAEGIITEVAVYFGITEEDLKSRNKKRRFSYPRQLAAYMARELTGLSEVDIGNLFSRNHSTIYHAWKKIGILISFDRETQHDFNIIQGRINLRYPSQNLPEQDLNPGE